jgi:putative transposase
MVPRPRRQPTDDWRQLRLLVTSPEQESYELVRPILLFGQPPDERARETGVSVATLRRKAARVATQGLLGLFPQAPAPDGDQRRLPSEIRRAIAELKAEYPPFSLREIAAICRVSFGRPVDHQTVGRVLAAEPFPLDPPRRSPRYHELPDPVLRRKAIVDLYQDGWSPRAIAGYLATSRARVHEVLKRWDEEGWDGLPDRSRAPHRPARKVDLKTMALIRRLQENPGLGEFRIHAALEQQGIHLSPRTCGTILALHRALGAPRPATPVAHKSQPMPFAAARWHQWWSVDVRYIEDHALADPKPVYVISVLDNFSRAILASRLSPRQDLTAYLVVLREAIARFGVPDGIVSDGGGIFRATHARAVYRALGIRKAEIERGQAWQNYIEAMFSIMRRMADHDFSRAATWAALQAAHDRFVANYNHQPHFAHSGQPAGRRAPLAVLTWVTGRVCDPAEVDRVFRLRETRRIRLGGTIRYRHWRLYGERAIAGATAAVWLDEETLTIEHATDTLAQYRVAYETNRHHLREVGEPRLYATRTQIPQPFLPLLDTSPWQPAQRLAPYRPRRRRAPSIVDQTPLFPQEPIARSSSRASSEDGGRGAAASVPPS